MEDPNNPSKEILDRWSKDPNNWIWGMFYYNPKDKRIFPPKKFPWMGWTVNFANPKSIIVFLIIFLLLFFSLPIIFTH